MISTRPVSDKYRENYDRVFRHGNPPKIDEIHDLEQMPVIRDCLILKTSDGDIVLNGEN